MLRIPCPHCGIRDESEFRYAGQARVARPTVDTEVAWAKYLYVRDNPSGPHQERWLHLYGCGQWVEITRDTRTHEWVENTNVG